MALVVDEEAGLLGVITDGDIRRAILKGVLLEDSVTLAMSRDPVTGKPYHTKGELFRMMVSHCVSHIPVVDDDNKLLGIVYEDALRRESLLTAPVVIMAGGLGTRLRPLTEKIPKPMLKVNGKPMLEQIIERFRDLGTVEFYISVNYKAHVVENYFGDGSDWRVQIRYLKEERRLGTAGSLTLLPQDIQRPFFVINGDVITDLDFRAIYQFHRDNEPDLTVAVKKVSFQVPYGAIETDNGRIVSLSEKPHIEKCVNSGIYVADPRVIEKIPANEFFDMTDLINKLIAGGKKVNSYLIDGAWMDVGQKEDYSKANSGLDKDNGGKVAIDSMRLLEQKPLDTACGAY